MRYFGGYTEPEIAETLEVTERTVQSDGRRRGGSWPPHSNNQGGGEHFAAPDVFGMN